MARRRKTLLIGFALVCLAAGGLAWYWQATAATAMERQVDALLDEFRTEKPGFVERWLVKLGLRKGRRTGPGVHVRGDLVKLGPPAVPYLIRALADEDPDVRIVAAHALRRLGDARAVEPLIAVLKDEDKDVRFFAAWELGALGDARAVEPLAELLGDESLRVRKAARGAIDRIRAQSGAKSRPSRQTIE